MRTLKRRILLVQGEAGIGAQAFPAVFMEVIDQSVPEPGEAPKPTVNFSECLTAYVGQLEGDRRLVERLPRESIEALQARCAKFAPHIAFWMPVHTVH